MSSQDLRHQAQRLRGQLPERRGGNPPPETGRRLATISRPKDDEEIRINWCEYEGHPYLGVRFWRKGDDGQLWPDRHRGFSIRLRELPDVADAISEALSLAEEHQAQRSAQRRPQPPRLALPGPQADRSRGQGPGQQGGAHRSADGDRRRWDGNLPGLEPGTAGEFDEFADG